jgi:D-glycero-alpha-D-manno-heptose 1-phosphate guanylyltransferase
VVIAVRPVPDRARYGAVRVEDGHVRAFGEKALGGPGLVNSGTYVARRDLTTRFPAGGAFSFEQAILQERLTEIDLRAFEVAGDAFIDIGTPEDYGRAQTLIPIWTRGGA